MAHQTLAEAGELINDQIVRGVVEDVIDLDPMMAMIPFTSFVGQTVTSNREKDDIYDTGFTDVYAVGAQITARDPMEFEQHVFSVTKLIGDAEMDELVQIQSASAGVDQMAIEISGKVKGIGRRFQQGLATDDGTGANMNSLEHLVEDAAYGNGLNSITPGSSPATFSFDLLDEVLEKVTAKGGAVDWIVLPKGVYRQYKSLLRGDGAGVLPGVGLEAVLNVPFSNGLQRTVLTYEGIPVFRNDFLSEVESAGGALTGGALTSIYCGTFDTGDKKSGLAGIYPAGAPAGVVVNRVGTREEYDEEIWRIKWYANLANFTRRGLARYTDITP